MNIKEDSSLFSKQIYNFLKILKDRLLLVDDISPEAFKEIINQIKKDHDISANIWKPIRIALTGEEHGPDISAFASILGKSLCIDRIQSFLDCNVN